MLGYHVTWYIDTRSNLDSEIETSFKIELSLEIVCLTNLVEDIQSRRLFTLYFQDLPLTEFFIPSKGY